MSTVMTVTGPAPAESLGKMLPHEHLFINLTRQILIGGVINDFDLVVREVEAFAAIGGKTIVDLTTRDNGRRPELLRRVAEKTGINILMGCGFYREPYIDGWFVDRHSVQELSERILQEITEGVGGTGVRPGVIGEVGSEEYITSVEERVLRAAGRAHLASGLTISTHAGRWPNGMRQLLILQAEGVDARNVIIGHCDTVPELEYHEALARSGAWVQFDTIRGSSPYATQRRVDFVMHLVRKGFIDHILVSHDVCLMPHLLAEGGTGYTFVHGSFSSLLLDAGLNESEVEQITATNPRRALSGV